MVEDTKDDPVAQGMDIYALLYIHMAKEVIETFGKDGEEAVRRAIRNFGIERGKRLRARHEAEGRPINLKSLFTHYDLGGTKVDPRFKRNLLELTENTRYSLTLRCPVQERWREVGPSDIGVIYCEEFHPAMWDAYLEGTVTLLPKLLSRGDEHCQFEVYRLGHKRDTEELLKKQQS